MTLQNHKSHLVPPLASVLLCRLVFKIMTPCTVITKKILTGLNIAALCTAFSLCHVQLCRCWDSSAKVRPSVGCRGCGQLSTTFTTFVESTSISFWSTPGGSSRYCLRRLKVSWLSLYHFRTNCACHCTFVCNTVYFSMMVSLVLRDVVAYLTTLYHKVEVECSFYLHCCGQ